MVTGLCDRASIAATTVAVERVVLRHLEEQLRALRGVDLEAVSAIEANLQDERAHLDRAAQEPRHSTELVIRRGYVLEHDSLDKIPLWVCESVSADQLRG